MKVRYILYLLGIAVLLVTGCSYPVNTGARFSAGGVVMSVPVTSAQEIKWKNVIRQGLDISCGPAALATVINFYLEEDVSEMDIISHILQASDMDKIKTIQKRQAFSLLDLKQYAVSMGYEAEGYKVSAQDLVAFEKPVIIPIETIGYSHFVVFKGIKGDRVFIADPAFGNSTMRYPHFLYAWKQRVALVVDRPKASTDEVADHGLSIGGLEGVYVEGSVHRYLNPTDMFMYSAPGSF